MLSVIIQVSRAASRASPAFARRHRVSAAIIMDRMFAYDQLSFFLGKKEEKKTKGRACTESPNRNSVIQRTMGYRGFKNEYL